jgi:hypothetical protein
MHQRQVKAEEGKENTLRLRAPNLPTHDLTVQPAAADAGWQIDLYHVPAEDGERTLIAQSVAPVAAEDAAWEMAYELYRQRVIV